MTVSKNAVVTSGTLTIVEDKLKVDVKAASNIAVACTSGNWGATTAVTFEVSIDNTNWVALAMLNTASAAHGTRAITALANGEFIAAVDPYRYFRARLSVVDAGPVAVKILLSEQAFRPFIG